MVCTRHDIFSQCYGKKCLVSLKSQVGPEKKLLHLIVLDLLVLAAVTCFPFDGDYG